jgi:hypothetical protein
MKRSQFTLAFTALLLFSAYTVSARAEEGPTSDSEHACNADHYHDDGLVTYAESKDQKLAASSTNHISPGMNGSVRVHGWSQGDVLVRACIHASALTDSEARALASQISIARGPGEIVPSGPEGTDKRHWSVSYQVWVPTSSNLNLEAHNGSIAVQSVRGTVGFHTLNGSVHLEQVAGNVDGATTNGSVVIDVEGNGHEIRAKTTNGSIRLNLPENYSAKIEASTVNGRVHCDFPATVTGDIGGKTASLTLGSGGPVIEAHTVNGSIHIGRRTS